VGTSRTISKSRDLKPSPDLVLVDGEVSKKETAVKVVEAALSHLTIAGALHSDGEFAILRDTIFSASVR
jgi:hypothetical protein